MALVAVGCQKKAPQAATADTYRWPDRISYRIDYVSTVQQNGATMVRFAESKTARMMEREGRFLVAFDSVLKTSERPGQRLRVVPFQLEDTLLFYMRLGPRGQITDITPGCDPGLAECMAALPSSSLLEMRRVIPRLPDIETQGGWIDTVTFDDANRPHGLRGSAVISYTGRRDTTIGGRVYSLIGWRSIRRSFLPGAEGRADLGAQQAVNEEGITLVDRQLMVPAYSIWAGAVPAPASLRAVGATASGYRGRAYLAGSVFDSLYSREMVP